MSIHGTDGNNTIGKAEGVTEGADIIWGEGGADILYGLGGNDTLIGGGGGIFVGEGGDILNGGEGFDTASYVDSYAAVVVNLATGYAAGGDAEGDQFVSIENLFGSTYGDFLAGDGTPNRLDGYQGDDTLKGGGGADILDGGHGADNMIGGSGDDTYYVDNASDVVRESIAQGNDTVLTSVSWILTAGAHVEMLRTTNDTGTAAIDLMGNERPNTIVGNDGDNHIKGGGGADQMIGRDGNDTYVVDNSADVVTESSGEGMDTVHTSVSYYLADGAEVEVLRTTDTGGVAGINLVGNSGDNLIRGNNGSNIISGRGGHDELIGGGGQDYFWFATALDPTSNVDELSDFNVADDTMVLDHSVFGAFTAGASTAGRLFIPGFGSQGGDDNLVYVRETGQVFYDSDGSGGIPGTLFAEVAPFTDLLEPDFLIV